MNMQLTIVAFMASLLYLPAAAQKNIPHTRGTAFISGSIRGTDTGTVYLEATDIPYSDSARLQKGQFHFTVPVTSPVFCVVRISPRQGKAFFIEQGRLGFNGQKDSLSQAVISGSSTEEDYLAYQRQWKQVHEKAGPIYQRLDSITRAHHNQLDTASRLAFDKAFADLETFANSIQDHFIRLHNYSPVAAFVIVDRYMAYNKLDKAAELFAVLTPAMQQSFYGKQITRDLAIARKTSLGARPDFAMNDTAGNPLTLSSLRGRYVLVDFWASWCGPCRKENPNLVAAYQAYHSQGFDIVGVSLDDKKMAWLKAIQKDGLTWHQVSDLKGWKNEAVLAYGIKMVPANFLLSPDGKVIAKNLRGEALQQKLAALLPAKPGAVPQQLP